jgi:uncharacterized damage-inducible protein DinB
MKQHILDLFKYNDWANQKLVETIKQLPYQEEAVKLYSHLILAQDKWYNRITKRLEDSSFNWMMPLFSVDELAIKWHTSITEWIAIIELTAETDLQQAIVFNRASDGKQLSVTLLDLCLQLNYHSMHHRAQINTLISKQGIVPPATDYIFTKLKEN